MTTLNEAIDQLRELLPQYLEERGVLNHIRQPFRCIHPAHNDKSPSSGVVPGNPATFHCFGCGFSGNIFHAANFIEGLPSSGPDFFTHTIPTLCERYGIEFDPTDISPEDLVRQKIFQITADVANILVTEGSFEYAQERGWSEKTCHKLGIATLPYEQLMEKLLGRWTEKEIEEACIVPQLFHKNGLTFTLHDKWGRPVGFSCRNMLWKSRDDGPKYVNTRSSPIFPKKHLLYNFNRVRSVHRRVYIVEGYACVATAYENGIENVVAVCGAEVHPEQVDLLSEHQVDTAILALDSDPAGSTGTQKALDNVFGGREDIRVKVLDLSNLAWSDYEVKVGPERRHGHCDLDEALRIDPKYLSHNAEVDPFEWRLSLFSEDAEPFEIAERMVPLIVSEQSAIRREKLSQILAKVTGIDKLVVDREVSAKLRQEDQELERRVRTQIAQLHKRIDRSPPSKIPELLTETASTVASYYSVSSPEEQFSPNSTARFLEEFREDTLKTVSEIRGFRTSLDQLDKKISGVPKQSAFIAIPAQPHVGKTGFVTQLGHDILEYNKDVMVLQFSIDDTRDKIAARWVAMDSKTDIRWVTNPSQAPRAAKERIDESWKRLLYLVRNQLYDIRDASQGTTLDFMENWLAKAHREYPEKNIVFILDNFHKVEGVGQDERVKFKNISSRIHRMKSNPTLGQPTIICTMELNRTKDTGGKYREPTATDISETNQINYDVDVIWLMCSDYYSRENIEAVHDKFIHRDEFNHKEIYQPLVKLKIEKDKINGSNGSLVFNFLSIQSRFKIAETLEETEFIDTDRGWS